MLRFFLKGLDPVEVPLVREVRQDLVDEVEGEVHGQREGEDLRGVAGLRRATGTGMYMCPIMECTLKIASVLCLREASFVYDVLNVF